MIAGDCKFGHAVIEAPAPDRMRIDIEVRFFQRKFDRDLPNARGTESRIIAAILDQRIRRFAEFFCFTSSPDEQMRIEQQLYLSLLALLPNMPSI